MTTVRHSGQRQAPRSTLCGRPELVATQSTDPVGGKWTKHQSCQSGARGNRGACLCSVFTCGDATVQHAVSHALDGLCKANLIIVCQAFKLARPRCTLDEWIGALGERGVEIAVSTDVRHRARAAAKPRDPLKTLVKRVRSLCGVAVVPD